jgi:hypothetical protein
MGSWSGWPVDMDSWSGWPIDMDSWSGWPIDMDSFCGSSDIDMNCSCDMLIPSLFLICVLVRHAGPVSYPVRRDKLVV